jgi:phage shock protein A
MKDTLERKIKDLQEENERKKKMAKVAVAANETIKSNLDEALAKIAIMQSEKDSHQAAVKRAEEEMLKYQQKHDEMFNSVNSLNNRIEELEDHKLHLLNKLKQYGDKGDLEYIIKTQKLDSVKHKGFE